MDSGQKKQTQHCIKECFVVSRRVLRDLRVSDRVTTTRGDNNVVNAEGLLVSKNNLSVYSGPKRKLI
jgi:hypothetical protein